MLSVEEEVSCNVALWLTFIVSVIINIYCIHILRQEKRAVYFVKRDYELVCWGTGVQFGFLFWQMVSFYFWNYVAHDKNNNGSKTDDFDLSGAKVVFAIILIFFSSAPMPTESVLLSVRLWLYYYNLQLTKFNRNKEWRVIIDPKSESSVNNWFVRHRYTISRKNVRLFVIILILLVNVAMLCFIIYHPTRSQIVAFAFWIMLLSLINGYLLFGKVIKTQQYGKSNLGLKNEVLFVILLLVSFLVCFGKFHLLSYFQVKYFIISTIWKIEAMSILTIWTCVTVIYPKYYYNKLMPLHKRKKRNRKRKRNRKKRGISKSSSRLKHLEVSFLDESNYSSNCSTRSCSLTPSTTLTETTISWTHLVSFYDGFEAIMNHLEKEWSMENLLYLQEYIQTKNVLNDLFEPILKRIYSKQKHNSRNRRVLRELKLPPSTKTNRHPSASSSTIPESVIAKTLRNEINNFFNYNDKDNKKNISPGNEALLTFSLAISDSNANANVGINLNSNSNCKKEKKIDVISQSICIKIIGAFSQLYYKYIDTDASIYMINISSRNRKRMEYLFDVYYYKDTIAKEKKKKQKEKRKLTNDTKEKFSFAFPNGFGMGGLKGQMFDFGKDKVGIKEKLEMVSFIKHHLKVYINEDAINGENKTEIDLIEWLLNEIIPAMDACLVEIIYLMDDAFRRFKLQNDQLFDDLCQSITIF